MPTRSATLSGPSPRAARPTSGKDERRFAIVPQDLLFSPVSDRAVRLYAFLNRHADDRSLTCFPGRARLAAQLRCSNSSVDRAVQELVDVGAVVVVAQFDGHGDRTSNLFRLTPEGVKGVASHMQQPHRSPDATGSRTAASTVDAPVTNRTRASETRASSEEGGGEVIAPSPPARRLRAIALRLYSELRSKRGRTLSKTAVGERICAVATKAFKATGTDDEEACVAMLEASAAAIVEVTIGRRWADKEGRP